VGSVPAAAAAGPAQPTTLWSFLGLSKSNLSGCKAAFCQSQFGTLVNNGMLPISGLTGGILGGCCPTTPTASQLAAAEAAGGAEAVAAKIKAEEAGAKARIAAVEYLATVDCRYWPDAEGALIDRLRADRNECVRYAAARALGTGCCCTKKTIAALKLVVECSDEDGNPPEASERVKAASWYALHHCVDRYVPPRPEPRERPSEPSRPEYPAAYRTDSGAGARAQAYAEDLENTPDSVLIEEARRVLVAARNAPLGDRTLPTGSRSVLHAFVKASTTTPPAPPPPTTMAMATADPPRSVEFRTTAPPVPSASAPTTIPPSPSARPEADRSVRPAAAELRDAGPRRPRSLLEIFNASRRPNAGA
jgi:hypothetical protein